jgi:hypothetical protein
MTDSYSAVLLAFKFERILYDEIRLNIQLGIASRLHAVLLKHKLFSKSSTYTWAKTGNLEHFSSNDFQEKITTDKKSMLKFSCKIAKFGREMENIDTKFANFAGLYFPWFCSCVDKS